ncbi:hypothetical protein DERF_009037 [Dermatophagoides farinae]|uniref:DNA helicase Pif1-like 2B domain-containing protein n=1 Tax=Dermatophagoides farinae TaxID=6954 RepID=A0A922L258_DERFA|nr:hypothetical protein DERF_009037 [Dermatophagoides farinae]
MAKKVILTTTNDSTFFQYKNIKLIHGENAIYYSIDNIAENHSGLQFNVECLHAMNPQGYPRHKLELKVGSIIMLIRNVEPQSGLLNGTRLFVNRRSIEARILTRRHDSFCSKTIEILSYHLNWFVDDFLSVYLPTPVLQHGMIYVAFCRCKNPNNLKIFVQEIEEISTTTTVSIPKISNCEFYTRQVLALCTSTVY